MQKDSKKVEEDLMSYELWNISEAQTEIDTVVRALEQLFNVLKDIEDEE